MPVILRWSTSLDRFSIKIFSLVINIIITYFGLYILLIIFLWSHMSIVKGVIDMYFDLIALKSLDLVDFAAVPTGPILARIF